MDITVPRPFVRKHGAAKIGATRAAGSRIRAMRLNTVAAVGLWATLWAGYNTGLWYINDPHFPADTLQLVHGLRAFAPLLGAWVALCLMLARIGQLSEWVLSRQWIISPLGLLLLYAIVGLASSAFVSVEPEDAMYWGGVYLSIVMVLLAIVPVEDPLLDLRRVMEFNWIVDSLLTLSLLGALPFLGKGVAAQMEGNPMNMRAYGGNYGETLGMASTRNTGFARYAAVAGIVALGRVWEGKPAKRLFWGALLLVSAYALVLSNGRTEILAFIVSAFVVLIPMKKRRAAFIVMGAAAAMLLGLVGFYDKFFRYITRSGHIDTNVVTMSGRTVTWEEGWKLFVQSPLWGFGFQADRYYLGQHLHNAYLHVFVQAGILGGGAILLALMIVWLLTIKYFFVRPPKDRSLVPPEIPGVLLFVTISSVTESTFAYFSAAWLLSAPIFPYVLALDRQIRRSRALDALQRNRELPLTRLRVRGRGPANLPGAAPPIPG